MVSVQLSHVTLFQSGQIDVTFSDGAGQSFQSPAMLAAWVSGIDAPENQQLAQQLLLKWWLVRDPSLASPGMAVGKMLTFDMAQPLSIEVSS